MSASSAELIAKTAKAAFEAAQLIPSSERIRALNAIKAALELAKSDILAANQVDLDVRTT
jgi:glutamate-5-semialdehyde dehydrogenase